MNVLDHGPKCICVPCSLKSGRLLTVEGAAKLLRCRVERVIRLAAEGKLNRAVWSSAAEPVFFAESVRELTARRKRTLPRTPEDQALRWKIHDTRLRDKYGIDAEDWARMFEAQGGRCPGCQKKLRHWHSTHVDHCHKTAEARGLLCFGCNTTLGAARDRPDTLRNLALYLEKSG
jgi:hypothetical protein